jgi:hypothetical protein
MRLPEMFCNSKLKQPLIKGDAKVHIVEQIQTVNLNQRIKIDKRRISQTFIGNRLRLQNLINDLGENLTRSLEESVVGVIGTCNRLKMRDEDTQVPDKCRSR